MHLPESKFQTASEFQLKQMSKKIDKTVVSSQVLSLPQEGTRAQNLFNINHKHLWNLHSDCYMLHDKLGSDFDIKQFINFFMNCD